MMLLSLTTTDLANRSFLSEIREKVVLQHLNDYLASTGCYDNISGFCPFQRTGTALFKVGKTILVWTQTQTQFSILMLLWISVLHSTMLTTQYYCTEWKIGLGFPAHSSTGSGHIDKIGTTLSPLVTMYLNKITWPRLNPRSIFIELVPIRPYYAIQQHCLPLFCGPHTNQYIPITKWPSSGRSAVPVRWAVVKCILCTLWN